MAHGSEDTNANADAKTRVSPYVKRGMSIEFDERTINVLLMDDGQMKLVMLNGPEYGYSLLFSPEEMQHIHTVIGHMLMMSVPGEDVRAMY